jgi:hypothetical protein
VKKPAFLLDPDKYFKEGPEEDVSQIPELPLLSESKSSACLQSPFFLHTIQLREKEVKGG